MSFRRRDLPIPRRPCLSATMFEMERGFTALLSPSPSSTRRRLSFLDLYQRDDLLPGRSSTSPTFKCIPSYDFYYTDIWPRSYRSRTLARPSSLRSKLRLMDFHLPSHRAGGFPYLTIGPGPVLISPSPRFISGKSLGHVELSSHYTQTKASLRDPWSIGVSGDLDDYLLPHRPKSYSRKRLTATSSDSDSWLPSPRSLTKSPLRQYTSRDPVDRVTISPRSRSGVSRRGSSQSQVPRTVRIDFGEPKSILKHADVKYVFQSTMLKGRRVVHH
jgi:hypothetical protein